MLPGTVPPGLTEGCVAPPELEEALSPLPASEEEAFSISASPFSARPDCSSAVIVLLAVVFASSVWSRETEGTELVILSSLTGTPLTTPPPVACFLGLDPTKKANKNKPPTRAKTSNPIFLLSGTAFPLCSLVNRRFHKDLTASRLFARWISFSRALVIPPPRSKAVR